MDYFADTGPFAKTWGDCQFRGYRRTGRETYNAVTDEYTVTEYKRGGCAKFHEFTGNHGPPISGKLRACKYSEQKPAT